jgi:uncharacterized protein (DUF2126 family)
VRGRIAVLQGGKKKGWSFGHAVPGLRWDAARQRWLVGGPTQGDWRCKKAVRCCWRLTSTSSAIGLGLPLGASAWMRPRPALLIATHPVLDWGGYLSQKQKKPEMGGRLLSLNKTNMLGWVLS